MEKDIQKVHLLIHKIPVTTTHSVNMLKQHFAMSQCQESLMQNFVPFPEDIKKGRHQLYD